MSRTSFARTRLLARIATPLLLASMLGACSSIPDWVDPTGWFGGDSQASADQSGGATADAAQAPDSGKTPDLASIPPRPAPPSTPDEQQQVSNSLAADRSQAKYSAENLQGDAAPVASPPPAESAPAAPADQPATAPAASAPTSTADNTPSDSSTSTADSGTAMGGGTETAAQPAAAPEDSSGTQVASTEPPAATAPAAAPMAPAVNSAPPANMQAGFAPSHAPALDASVTQYVPERILSRYRQTAAAAAVPGVEGMPGSAAAKPAHRRKAKTAATVPADDTAAPAR